MKKWLIILGILLLVGVGVFYIFSQPPKDQLSEEYKKKAIENMLGRQANLNPEPEKTGTETFKGKYISFQYPAKAEIYTYQDPNFKANDSRLEDFSFDIRAPRLIFNLQVLKVSSNVGSVMDYPSVRLRETRSEYSKSTTTIGPVKGITYFNNSKNPEKTGFFLKNNIIYSLSVTGTDSEEVSKLYDSMIQTVSFSSSPAEE